jgi:hypothetical protein
MRACLCACRVFRKRFRPLLSPEDIALLDILTTFKHSLDASRLAKEAPAYAHVKRMLEGFGAKLN